MNKRSIALLLACALVLVAVPFALAFDGTTVADSWVDNTSSVRGTATTVKTQSSNVSGCAVEWTSYLKWDISSIQTEPVGNKQIDNAAMTLVNRFANFSQPITVSVYKAASDTWEEATLNGTNAPGVTGGVLTSVTLNSPPAVGATIAFPSTPAFVSYLNTVNVVNGGNGKVSLAVQISGCGVGSSRVDFDSREGTVPPQLSLKNPNAVGLGQFSANQESAKTSWPLYAGLAAVALVVVAGVMLSRRRTA